MLFLNRHIAVSTNAQLASYAGEVTDRTLQAIMLTHHHYQFSGHTSLREFGEKTLAQRYKILMAAPINDHI